MKFTLEGTFRNDHSLQPLYKNSEHKATALFIKKSITWTIHATVSVFFHIVKSTITSVRVDYSSVDIRKYRKLHSYLLVPAEKY